MRLLAEGYDLTNSKIYCLVLKYFCRNHELRTVLLSVSAELDCFRVKEYYNATRRAFLRVSKAEILCQEGDL